MAPSATEFPLRPHPNIPKADGPVLVCILDGFGYNKEDQWNAIHVADTPVYDRLKKLGSERFRWGMPLLISDASVLRFRARMHGGTAVMGFRLAQRAVRMDTATHIMPLLSPIIMSWLSSARGRVVSRAAVAHVTTASDTIKFMRRGDGCTEATPNSSAAT